MRAPFVRASAVSAAERGVACGEACAPVPQRHGAERDLTRWSDGRRERSLWLPAPQCTLVRPLHRQSTAADCAGLLETDRQTDRQTDS